MATEADVTERPIERLVFFTDAVVAIAMTLLILPLLEGVSEAGREGLSTREYVTGSGGQLFSFVLSFLIIASFWTLHHGLYQRVRQYTPLLLWLSVAWMFTIVWLPVATAMVGLLETDWLETVLYIGTMLVSSLLLTACYVVVRRHPEVWSNAGPPRIGGLAATIALSGLYAVALLVALLVPPAGYFPLLLLVLTSPLQRLVAGRLRAS